MSACANLDGKTCDAALKQQCDDQCGQFSAGFNPHATLCGPLRDVALSLKLQDNCKARVKSDNALLCNGPNPGDENFECFDLSNPPTVDAAKCYETGTGRECDLLCKSLFGRNSVLRPVVEDGVNKCTTSQRPIFCGCSPDDSLCQPLPEVCLDLATPAVCYSVNNDLLLNMWNYVSQDPTFQAGVISQLWADLDKLSKIELNSQIGNLYIGSICGITHYFFGFDAGSFFKVITDSIAASRIQITQGPNTTTEQGATHYVSMRFLPCNKSSGCLLPNSKCDIGGPVCSAGTKIRDKRNTCDDPCQGNGICLSNSKYRVTTLGDVDVNICLCLKQEEGVFLQFGVRCDGNGCIYYTPTDSDKITVSINDISYPGSALPDWLTDLAKNEIQTNIESAVSGVLFHSVSGLIPVYFGKHGVTGGIDLSHATTCNKASTEPSSVSVVARMTNTIPVYAGTASLKTLESSSNSKADGEPSLNSKEWMIFAFGMVVSVGFIIAGALVIAFRPRGANAGRNPNIAKLLLGIGVLFLCVGIIAMLLSIGFMLVFMQLNKDLRVRLGNAASGANDLNKSA